MLFTTCLAWARRIVASCHEAAHDEEIANELAAHLEMHIDDNVREGMSLSTARREALIKLGGVRQTIEACQDVRHHRHRHRLFKYVARILEQ